MMTHDSSSYIVSAVPLPFIKRHHSAPPHSEGFQSFPSLSKCRAVFFYFIASVLVIFLFLSYIQDVPSFRMSPSA